MSAKMYPSKEQELFPKTPIAERLVYNALSKLPSEYVIFHSVEWAKKNTYIKHISFFENDFLLLHPKYGILVIEVKGGDISFDEDGYIHQKNTETGEEVILNKGNDPLTQATRGINDCYIPYIQNKIPDITDMIGINPCVWFPKMEKSKIGELPLSYETCKGAILFGDALENIESSIKSVFKFYFADSKIGVSNNVFKEIQSIIAPVFDLIPSNTYCKQELDEAFLHLTNEQTILLDYLDEQKVATIQGAAGTGKTIIATEKARRLVKEERKPLYLCFNRMLSDYLNSIRDLKGVKIDNITHFIYEELNKKKILIDDSKEEWELLYSIDFRDLDYSDVIIDEAQDFFTEEIEYFKDYAKQKDGSFYTFFDKNQLIIKDQMPKWILDSECRLVLSKNCRNTMEIAKTSFSVIDFDIKSKLSGISSVKPKLLLANEDNYLSSLKNLINWYTGSKNGYSLDDIVILTLKNLTSSILNNVSSIYGIPVSSTKKKGEILFTTAKKFKGLEAKCIIVVDIDEKSFSEPECKRVFYVACSRAMHRLSLFIVGDDNKIKTIANSISGPKFAPIGKIKNKTQTEPF